MNDLTMYSFLLLCSEKEVQYGKVGGFELVVTPRWRRHGIVILNFIVGETLWKKYGGNIRKYTRAVEKGIELEYKLKVKRNKNEDLWDVIILPVRENKLKKEQ